MLPTKLRSVAPFAARCSTWNNLLRLGGLLWRRGLRDYGLFRDTDPAGEVEDLRDWAEEDAGDDGEDADQANVPAVGLSKADADAGKLAAEDGPDKTWKWGVGHAVRGLVACLGISGDHRAACRAKARGWRQDASTVI